jgi:hypothetical protein
VTQQMFVVQGTRTAQAPPPHIHTAPVPTFLSVFSATNKAIYRIWNITIYRLVVISETIQRTVHRRERERENLHDGIWIIVPAPTVVSGQVFLDRDPGALYWVHDTPIQLETRVQVCLSVWHAYGSTLSLRYTPSKVCTRRDRCRHV